MCVTDVNWRTKLRKWDKQVFTKSFMTNTNICFVITKVFKNNFCAIYELMTEFATEHESALGQNNFANWTFCSQKHHTTIWTAACQFLLSNLLIQAQPVEFANFTCQILSTYIWWCGCKKRLNRNDCGVAHQLLKTILCKRFIFFVV